MAVLFTFITIIRWQMLFYSVNKVAFFFFFFILHMLN